ncbi:hypothetical protein MF6394_02175 [Pseudomonas sp. MF6394]|nr:hypothetical protein MF6394_02175 [Pseudomonas sp. MF6394]
MDRRLDGGVFTAHCIPINGQTLFSESLDRLVAARAANCEGCHISTATLTAQWSCMSTVAGGKLTGWLSVHIGGTQPSVLGQMKGAHGMFLSEFGTFILRGILVCQKHRPQLDGQ